MSTPADLVARGIALAQSGRWAEALDQFQRSAALAPANAAVWSNLALALRTLGRTGEALGAIARAVAIDPAIADAWNVYGLVEQDRGDFEAARSHYRRALSLNPRFAQAWMNLGNSAQALGDSAAALAAYGKALAIEPRLAEVHYNLGLLRQNRLGDIEQAIAHYREAIRLAPDYALAHNNLAHALFLLGRFDEAWREHVWRRTGRGSADVGLEARRILVAGEQGLGDTLFYLRYAPALHASGAILDFAGDPRLHPMLARTGLFETLAAAAEKTADGVQVPAGDLPLAATPAGRPMEVPPPLPLTADARRVDAMRARLEAFGPAPHIAIAWRAGVPKTELYETLYKAVPPGSLGAALRPLEATFVSVQREPRADESAALAAALGHRLHDLTDVNRDLEDTLALMSAVDAYVGPSSTNVHLRASAGRGGHVLVPFPPEWRWMAAGDSPWFPRMRVYRQEISGAWEPAMRALAADLAARRT